MDRPIKTGPATAHIAAPGYARPLHLALEGLTDEANCLIDVVAESGSGAIQLDSQDSKFSVGF